MRYAAVLGVKGRQDGYLEGRGYLISWCFGHLWGLADAVAYDPKYKKWNQTDLPILPTTWQYQLLPGSQKQMALLRRLMDREDVTEIVNACDPGREGELIFRNVYNLAQCTKPMLRLWVSSMEDEAIREGFAHLRPGLAFNGVYEAALCRAQADWLVGINATRLFSTAYHRTLVIGRVISPTLSMVANLEQEIAGHKPETFYKVAIQCAGLTAVTEKMDKAEADGLPPAPVEQQLKPAHPPCPPDRPHLRRRPPRANHTAGNHLGWGKAAHPPVGEATLTWWRMHRGTIALRYLNRANGMFSCYNKPKLRILKIKVNPAEAIRLEKRTARYVFS